MELLRAMVGGGTDAPSVGLQGAGGDWLGSVAWVQGGGAVTLLIPPPARRGGVAVQPGGKKSSVSQRFGNQRGKKNALNAFMVRVQRGWGRTGQWLWALAG